MMTEVIVIALKDGRSCWSMIYATDDKFNVVKECALECAGTAMDIEKIEYDEIKVDLPNANIVL